VRKIIAPKNETTKIKLEQNKGSYFLFSQAKTL